MKKIATTLAILFISVLAVPRSAFAHCDTMDGPVVKDAYASLEKNNVNYILKWVASNDEDEIRNIFQRAMKVRPLSADAKILAEKYLIETLVRIHRASEGVPYEGVKPSGTPVDKAILAADKAIEAGNIDPLRPLVSKEKLPRLNSLFNEVMRLKNFDANDVKAGRDYVEAYVQFFHFAEGEDGAHESPHGGSIAHLVYEIPIVLSIVLFITSMVFIVLYFRVRNKFQ